MSTIDHFAAFGLPVGWDLDRAALERRYLELQQAHHPDRVAAGSSGDQRAAVEKSAAINEGYRVLRDPVRRAEYVCKLGGVDLDSNEGAPKMDQAFLLEMIERREELHESRDLEALRQRVEGELDAALGDAVAALQGGGLDSAARALVRRRYLQRLADEIDARAEAP